MYFQPQLNIHCLYLRMRYSPTHGVVIMLVIGGIIRPVVSIFATDMDFFRYI